MITPALRGSAALVLLLLLACGCRTSPRISGPPPKVEVYLASFEAVEEWSPSRSRYGETVHLAPEPIIDLEDIHLAMVRRQGNDDFLLMNVKAGSQMRLDAATLAHLNRPVAVVVDGEPAYVAVLRTSISRQVPIRVGPGGITAAEARGIIEAIDDQRDFGPWSMRGRDPLFSRAGRVRASIMAPESSEEPPTAPGPGR